MEYKIKFGILKGKTPKEAINDKQYEELYKMRDLLKDNFNNENYSKYKKSNLEGFLAIEEAILQEYRILLKEFNKLIDKVDTKVKKDIIRKNTEVFYNYDIPKLKNIIKSIQ
ncbi:MAG: hypothetical protein ACOCRK_02710 [bacterium]